MRRIALFILLLFTITSFAQRGKNGNITVTTAQVVNEYTTLTADATTGSNSITVANSGLNTKGRFAGNLTTGDLVMVIQMQGATINGAPNFWWISSPNIGTPNDSSWGAVTAYNNCGNYEFAEVSSVPNATTIQFDCGLTNNYTAAGKVQVIRVPRYNALTINSGGSISCDAWDSAKGGIVALEVLGNTVINAGGSINVIGSGFRGGQLSASMDSSKYGVNNTAINGALMSWGKEKGEGIAGFIWGYDQFGGRYGKGAPANGGGGGDAHNAGGGGGSNAGSVAGWVDGIGVPDITTANNKAAWKLEYSWLPAFVGAGGGRGGYTFSANVHDPTTTGPNNVAWGGDERASQGGLGGRPLDYSTGRIFMGGGGGAGDQDDGVGGAGANGGGMVYLVSYGTVTGSGQITANGANGTNSTYNAGSHAGDGAGGAGGGGTVIINSTGNISGITIQANGGVGGNQVISALVTEAEGPGGGGGGGYIATSNALGTATANGGANGTTNASTMKKFPPNGATTGGTGTTTTISGFQIVAPNDTICSGQTASLSATLTGTVPGGTTINWYSTVTGGVPLASGSPYATVALTKDTIFYVGTCPGTYRQAVNVIIGATSSVTINPPATICAGSTTNLSASGGTAYSWLPAGSLSNPAIANPVASPTVTTTYTVNITTPCGAHKDSVIITVNPSPTVTLASVPSSTICSGSSITITASGGTGYSWTPATGLSATTGAAVTAKPAATTTYSVGVTKAGCTKDTSIIITVNPIPAITLTGATTICQGISTTITATGGGTYSWNTGSTTAAINVSPASTTTYSVQVTKAGCIKDSTLTINVNPKPSVTVTPPSPGICSGGSVGITASGAITYTWSPSAGLSGTTGATVTANPASTATYSVVGTSAAGCIDTTKVIVTVGASLTASITGKDTVCSGSSTTLTASGGSSYKWSNGTTSAALNVSPASTTTYSVLVSSGTCKDSATVTVKVNPSFNPGISGNNPICTGSNATITASGGGTYLWSTGVTTASINVSPASTTTYSVQVDNGGCNRDTTITVTVNNPPVVTITKGSTICAGKSVSLTATGGGTYAWSNGATTSTINVTPGATTTYSVTVSNGCPKDTSTVITVNPSPVVTISGSTSICAGNSTTITATGGGTYAWNTGATTAGLNITPASTTTYSVQVSNGTCSTDTTITVTVNAKPIPTISSAQTICDGTNTLLNAGGGSSYTWSPAAGLSCTTCANLTASPNTTTIYTVSIANGGCAVTDSVRVTVDPMPSGNAGGSTTIIAGQSTPLSIMPVTGGETYSWSPSAGLSCTACPNPVASPTVTTTYHVIISDSSGCTKMDSVIIKVDKNCGEVFIPEAFSPNGDGQNDVLYVRGDCIKSMDFIVFDRWGNKLFESFDPSNGWDGKYNGQPMNAGTYVYYLHAVSIYNDNFTQKGNITLVR